MFKNLPKTFRKDLRQHFMQHDVYVPIGAGIHMSIALFHVLTKKSGGTNKCFTRSPNQR